MFTKSHTWNTGRGYSDDGQTIEAIFVPNRIDDNGDQVGAIEFADITRGINGRFEDVRFTNREIPDRVFETVVLSRYDDGGYGSARILMLVSTDGYKTYQVERRTTPSVKGHCYSGGYYADGIYNAIDEAIIGNHVSHIKNPTNGRIVAIRPYSLDKLADRASDRMYFTLTFSDPKYDHRNTGDTFQYVTVKETEKAIRNFLTGIRTCQSCDYYQDHVNQADRDCEIIRTTATRVRIGYWLPNSGHTEAWRAYTQVGTYLYIQPTSA